MDFWRVPMDTAVPLRSPCTGAPFQPALADGCAPRDLGALLVRTRPALPTDGRRALLETAGVRGRAVSGSWRGPPSVQAASEKRHSCQA